MSLSKSPSPHIYSDGEKRHFRIMSMINEEGQHVLRLILMKQLAGTTLTERLADPAMKLKIEDALSRTKIQKDQFDILYPSSGIIFMEYIDVTLLAFLIRQLHPFMKVSNKTWTNPNHGDLSPEADATRLKKKRNKLVHLGKAKLTEGEFGVEFQELEMILCRLARYVSSVDLTVAELAQILNNKKNGVFERKPSTSNIATSTSSSLDKHPKSESDSASVCGLFESKLSNSNIATSASSSLDNNSISESDNASVFGQFESEPLNSTIATSTSISLDKDCVSESDNDPVCVQFESKPSKIATSISSSLDKDPTILSDNYSVNSLSIIESESSSISVTDIKKEATTSTSSLQQKRKLSFKVRSYLEPFIMPSKKEDEKENTNLPKRIKTKDKEKDSKQKCKSCSCSLRGSCKNHEANVVKTNDHSLQKYRCHLSGLITLNSGVLIAVDSSHGVVQALAISGEVIDEFECEQPNSVVAVGSDKFAVTLRQSRQVKILKFDKESNCIESQDEFDVCCDFWLCDVKYNNGYLYTLCENGDIHMLNVNTGSDAGLFPTKVQFASHFAITNKGDRMFISNGHHITCLDKYGNTIWCYSDKSKRTIKGVVLYKNTLFACVWDKDKIIAMATKDGKCLKEYRDEQMRYPWSLCLHKGKLFVSQYMSDLNCESCREIVVMKI